MTKDNLLTTIKDLPDNFSFDELMDRMILLKKIEAGLDDSDKKRTKTTHEAKEQLKKWLK